MIEKARKLLEMARSESQRDLALSILEDEPKGALTIAIMLCIQDMTFATSPLCMKHWRDCVMNSTLTMKSEFFDEKGMRFSAEAWQLNGCTTLPQMILKLITPTTDERKFIRRLGDDKGGVGEIGSTADK